MMAISDEGGATPWECMYKKSADTGGERRAYTGARRSSHEYHLDEIVTFYLREERPADRRGAVAYT
jgi:hypothetical protein